MGQTMVEEIAQSHLMEGPARPLRAGDVVSLRPRHVLTHDNTAAVMKKFANFDAGEEAIKKLTTIIMYAVIINTFFFLLEFFVGYYSEVPGHVHSLEYLFFGLEHHGHVYNNLVPFMWTATLFNFAGLGIFAYMKIAKVFDRRLVTLGAILIFFALWADKGLGFVFAGFVPNPLEEMNFSGTRRTFHATPVTPNALSPTAPIVPATCVP